MDKSPCCQAWIVEASEGNWCSKCKEDVKGVEIKAEVVGSHGLARKEKMSPEAYVKDSPVFPLAAHPEKE